MNVCALACCHSPHFDSHIKGRESCRKGGCGIPMDEDDIMLLLMQNWLDLLQNRGCDGEEGLVGRHDTKIIIWSDLEDIQDLF